MKLQDKIKNKKAKVGVVGLGYVGLPLSLAFLKAGFSVVGVDVSLERVESLKRGISPIADTPSSELKKFVSSGQFNVTHSYAALEDVETVSICVPTPLRKTREPDLSFIVQAASELQKCLHKDQLIVLESTTYPGTTDELVLPILEKSGLQVGEDFFLAFSPERIDPGNKEFGLLNTPKVIGGTTSQCLELASLLYSQISKEIIPVSSTKAAEMVKLLENTFRAVNIALVNEIALMAQKLDLDVWEIIDAAGTKPFGFLKFYPGPGLGGHCIPVDPQYLSWKLKTLNYHTRFIQLAEEINSSMPEVVVERVGEALNSKFKALNGSKILLVGVSYKKDVSDLRESPALEVWSLLESKGARVSYVDPFIPSFSHLGQERKSLLFSEARLAQYDCVVILTNHSSIDYGKLVEEASLVVDTRNATKEFRNVERVYKL